MTDIETLKQMIEERKQFLREVDHFVRDLFTERKLGKKEVLDSTSSSTHVKWKLENFHNFDFEAEHGTSMFGGDEVRIWHRPSHLSITPRVPVLEFHYVSRVEDFETKVLRYDDRGDWRPALASMMHNIDAILFEDVRIREHREETRIIAEMQRTTEEALYAEAERLGVKPLRVSSLTAQTD